MNLKRKMNRAAARKPSARIPAPKMPEREVTFEAIFCDCYDTLYSDSFERDELLVNYLNAKSRAGIDVVIFTSNFSQVYDKVQNIGLEPRILRTLQEKRKFHGEHLMEWIDDDPDPSITAQKLFHPKEPKFRQHMKDYLASCAPAAPSPDL